jgi:hypothetical protein
LCVVQTNESEHRKPRSQIARVNRAKSGCVCGFDPDFA